MKIHGIIPARYASTPPSGVCEKVRTALHYPKWKRCLAVGILAASITGCRNPQSDASSSSAASAGIAQATSKPENQTPALRAYDAKLSEAVRQRWYALLDENRFRSAAEGTVVVSFALHSSGRIRDVKAVQSDVSPRLERTCLQAVMDPAPYRPWPEEMRRTLKREVREITFTFNFGSELPKQD